MTIHVNIGEAKTRLSELIAAVLRGQDVILDKAGIPQVRLVPIEDRSEKDRAAVAARRRAAFGLYADRIADYDIDIAALKADRDAGRREAKARDGAA